MHDEPGSSSGLRHFWCSDRDGRADRSARVGGRSCGFEGLYGLATLEENPPGSDRIEMVLRVQGVKPGQPRVLVVPYELLLGDESLDPDQVLGKGFEAEATQDESGRWVVVAMTVGSSRALRAPEE